jgi:hypothetical protein
LVWIHRVSYWIVLANYPVCTMNPFVPILPFLMFNHDLLW